MGFGRRRFQDRLSSCRGSDCPGRCGATGEVIMMKDEARTLLPSAFILLPFPPVALHRLVGIHHVQAGRVETGQPHVAHDHDAEEGLAVLEAVCQLAGKRKSGHLLRRCMNGVLVPGA